jgi:hypothetical protein
MDGSHTIVIVGDTEIVGNSTGGRVGNFVGLAVCRNVGRKDGELVAGSKVGLTVVAATEGIVVGKAVIGLTVGVELGRDVVGRADGIDIGLPVVGEREGAEVGPNVSITVGEMAGSDVGEMAEPGTNVGPVPDSIGLIVVGESVSMATGATVGEIVSGIVVGLVVTGGPVTGMAVVGLGVGRRVGNSEGYGEGLPNDDSVVGTTVGGLGGDVGVCCEMLGEGAIVLVVVVGALDGSKQHSK